MEAAKAAKELGFDGIQLHCAHGYLLSQFLDPTTNLRTDDYGGSAANRFRFPGECLTAIRQAVGQDYPVLVKVNTNCAGEADEAYAQDIPSTSAASLKRWGRRHRAVRLQLAGPGQEEGAHLLPDRAKAIRQAVKIPSSWWAASGALRAPRPSWTLKTTLSPPPAPSSASRTSSSTWKRGGLPCIGCTKCLGNIWAKEGRRCVKHPIPPEFATQA